MQKTGAKYTVYLAKLQRMQQKRLTKVRKRRPVAPLHEQHAAAVDVRRGLVRLQAIAWDKCGAIMGTFGSLRGQYGAY